ncbi:PRC-barrel domain-containing protein [Paracoccus sp. KR1-242]|uniref:PRC-barrel domain-containing protein n=1 Tax=Paracoccus sp. KR1-242 TaxID=3410028 RepID=UPI003BFDDCEC
MNKLFATSAVIAILAGPALAQTAPDPAAPATTDAPATTMPADGAVTPPAAPAPDAAVAPADAAPADAATTAPAAGFSYMATAGDMSAETFIGKRLYTSETDVDPGAQINEVDKGWDDVGEISDLVLSKDGQLKAVLVDVGGFLGMGEKSVAVSMDQLRVIRDGDSENDYFIVFTADKAALEAAPAFEWPDM